MAKINGTLIYLALGADKILHKNTATLTVNVNLPDASTADDGGWATHINGQRDWSVAVDGKYDTAGSGLTPNEILTNIIARTADAALKFATDGTGSVGWTGNATFQNFSITGAHEDVVSWTATLKGNGALAAI